MKVLVCGGRDFDDGAKVARVLDAAVDRLGLSAVVHGDSRGADRLAGEWAKARRIPVEPFPADWHSGGGAAGPRRNQRMLDEAKPQAVIAFPGGKGTADMIARARGAGVTVYEVR